VAPGLATARRRSAGQSLVEFAMLIPVFLLLILGLLEFGFLLDQSITLGYASREGARSGAAFGNGNVTTMPCTGNGENVDKNIIAAVQRVLKGPGSRVAIDASTRIEIYNHASGAKNTWIHAPGAGPTVDGRRLDFALSGAVGWNACSRDTDGTGPGDPPQSLGIRVMHTYRFATPLAGIFGFFGPAGPPTLAMTDSTVMALNPSNQ
jgi:hypothetical protein